MTDDTFKADAPFPADVEAQNQLIADYVRDMVRDLEQIGFAFVVVSVARAVPSKEPGHEGSLFAPGATAVSMRRRIAPAVPHLVEGIGKATAMLAEKAAFYARQEGEITSGYRMEVPWKKPEERS